MEDHPHACGDKQKCVILYRQHKGSSPRVWGQDDNEGKTVGLTRIIPTRVGTSKHQNNIDELSQDHPHACGDKQSKIILRIETLGSSPRVWGQDKKQIRIGFFARIIPTRVGTS